MSRSVKWLRFTAFAVAAGVWAVGLVASYGCGKGPPAEGSAPGNTAATSAGSDASGAATVAVTSNPTATATATASAPPPAPMGPWSDGLLHGVVTGAGKPIAGARVRIRGGGAGALDHVDTSENGSFAVSLERTRMGSAAKITAGATGFRSQSFEIPRSLVSTASFDLPPLSPDRADYTYRSATKGTESCGSCHKSQVASWSGSRHASSATDPLVLDEQRIHLAWWQKVDPATASDGAIYGGPLLPSDRKGDTNNVFIEGGHRYLVLGDGAAATECANCHSPGHALAGGVDLRPEALAGKTPVLAEGVSCDPCHKVRDVRVATTADQVLPGFEKATLGRPSNAAPVTAGPLDDVVSPEMPSTWAPVMATGAFCATCHSDARVLRVQPVDAKGQPAGEIATRLIWGEDTFREWRFQPTSLISTSPVGAQGGTYDAAGDGPFIKSDNYAGRPLGCQDCHMQDPPPDPATHERIADYRDPARGETTIAVHHDAIPRDPRAFHPHRMEGRTRRFVEWATELSATATRNGTQLTVSVKIENRHTGHAFPTGLPDRNVIVLVEATDGEGALPQTGGPHVPVWASGDGKTDPGRDLAGRAGIGYARFLVDASGKGPVHYLRAVRASNQDNRLRAGATDRVTFQFTARRGPVKVRVRLLHRLRFKSQTDAYLTRHPGEDPGQFETPGDAVTVEVK
jgi:hypothetical protein